MADISQAIDSQADKDFLAQLYGFAERKSINGTYIANIKPLKGQRALVIVALGEQADAINGILMQAAGRDVANEIAKRHGF